MSVRFSRFLAIGILFACLQADIPGTSRPLWAGEALIKNGTRFEGRLIPVRELTDHIPRRDPGKIKFFNILLIHTSWQHYFVPGRQVSERIPAEELARYETFQLSQKRTGNKSMVDSLGAVRAFDQFDKFGRRTVTLNTLRGQIPIIQGVTDINPKYLRVTGLSHNWEFGLATTSLPPDELSQMLYNSGDMADPGFRLAIARFYLQAGLYKNANDELQSIIRDFPEMQADAQEFAAQLSQLRANQLLGELRRRRNAGQHRLAQLALSKFPSGQIGADVRRQLSELADDYSLQRETIARAKLLLDELQAELTEPEMVAAVAPLRTTVSDELDFETLPRLDAFLQLADDDSLSASQKLAFAYSGWVMGSANAISSLDETVRLWEAELFVQEYLRSADMLERKEVLKSLLAIEGVGPERIVKMIAQLRPPLEDTSIQPGQATPIELAGDGETEPIRYSVVLPTEYSPHHRYPLIVALRPAERSIEEILNWWAGTAQAPGQAQRHGYIVIAPEYLAEDAKTYGYDVAAHSKVLGSIRDARKRFHIDSDRVFLTGHGSGGDAVFDIGMSHPDVFAGAIPIAGISRNYCTWYWHNTKRLPFYVVGGELDREWLAQNSKRGQLNRMMLQGHDVIVCEFIGRGYESYYSEIHNLFDWMELHRRAKYVKRFEMKVLRPSENHFYWIQAHGLPDNALDTSVLAGNKRVTPMTLDAHITPGNSVRISRSGAKRHIIWLSPELIDFDKRVKVEYRGRQRFNGFLKPDIETILEDFRVRGDREKLYWTRLDID